MSKRRHTMNAAIFIALADVMMCLAGRLYLEHNRDKVEIEQEIMNLEAERDRATAEVEQKKAQAAQIQKNAAEEKKRFDQELAQSKVDAQAQKAEIDAQLKQKRADFENWDWVVHRFTTSQALTRPADAHIYLRKSGIYRDGQKKAMTDKQIVAWMKAQADLSLKRTDGDEQIVAMWSENAANDQYIRMMDIRDKEPELIDKVTFWTIVLPTGVKADPSQKGTEYDKEEAKNKKKGGAK